MNAQFNKGVLELCVLVLLSTEDRYGYDLIRQISSRIEISEGAVYPVLRRLMKEEYLSSYLRESSEGPARKYYRLTEKGVAYLERLSKEWKKLVREVSQLMEENRHD